jgi:hypothetical protein
MTRRLALLTALSLASVACGRSDGMPASGGQAPAPSAGATASPESSGDAASAAAAVDAATEAPARGAGLRLGFAFTVNQMGELEPCG